MSINTKRTIASLDRKAPKNPYSGRRGFVIPSGSSSSVFDWVNVRTPFEFFNRNRLGELMEEGW